MRSPALTALLAASALALGGFAVACSPKTTDDPAANPSAAATPTGTSINEATASFVRDLAIGDMFEIDSSKIALERSQTPEVKAYAQMMIDAHTATTAELGPLATAASITPPSALDGDHAGKLEELRTASAADFDDKYIDMQTAAHSGALNALRNYADNGENPGIRAFAAATAPKVQTHLDQIRALDKSPADDTAPATPPSPH
jgi:putative membrane protein